jgi:hypothetical protein
MGDNRRIARRVYWSEHDRDMYECPDCGRRESELRKAFEVHHIDGNPKNNQLDNLVALCQLCHNIREEKKPSLTEIQELLNITARQNSASTAIVIESREQYLEFERQAVANNSPAFHVNMTDSENWASVEFDFILSSGWRERTRDDGSTRKIEATLDSESVGTCNDILTYYEGVETRLRKPVNTMHMADDPCYFSSPSVRPEVAKSIACELQPIVLNRDRWVPGPKHR